MKKVNSFYSKRWLLVLVFLFPILSCTTINDIISPATRTPTPTATFTPTLTPTITFTPTKRPIANLNLEDIGLQKSDLPGGYEKLDMDSDEFINQLISSGSGAMADNLEKSYATIFISSDGSLFINMILVYGDTGSASDAYEDALGIQNSDDALDCSVGDACQGTSTTNDESGMTAYVITWRYGEIVIELAYAGPDDIGFDEMIRLADAIQSRAKGS